MTTLALADVRELDHVLSWRPLVFGSPEAERYVSGGNAIARHVLYSWTRNARLIELPGKSFDEGGLAELRSTLSRLAEEEDFVDSVTVDLTLDPDTGALLIAAAVIFVDGRPYPLEVDTASAAAAITALGSATA